MLFGASDGKWTTTFIFPNILLLRNKLVLSKILLCIISICLHFYNFFDGLSFLLGKMLVVVHFPSLAPKNFNTHRWLVYRCWCVQFVQWWLFRASNHPNFKHHLMRTFFYKNNKIESQGFLKSGLIRNIWTMTIKKIEQKVFIFSVIVVVRM